jgi:ketosteroid isomerase-like protein
MSRENIELVRRICELHRSEDFKAARKLIDRELEYEFVDFPEMEWPVATYKEVVDAIREYLEAWDELSIEAKEFVEGRDDQVGVVLEVRGRGQGGLGIDRHFVEIWTVHEGKAVAYRLYRGRDQALRSLERGEEQPDL